MTMSSSTPVFAPEVDACDAYLGERTGRYAWRAARYRMAAMWMTAVGLTHDMTVTDLGAGMTEFDYCLRAEFGWRGRYIPIDFGIDGTDLSRWTPPRRSDFVVALEIVEHLHQWEDLLERVMLTDPKGIVISTPNPRTTDVLAMDDTHVREVYQEHLEELEFTVSEEYFYGGILSGGRPDALFATWIRSRA